MQKRRQAWQEIRKRKGIRVRVRESFESKEETIRLKRKRNMCHNILQPTFFESLDTIAPLVPSVVGPEGTDAMAASSSSSNGEQQYSLRWNDFHSSILSSFRHLRDEEDFVDVTLACDSSSFTAHKVVLSACSPYFRKLLKRSFNTHQSFCVALSVNGNVTDLPSYITPCVFLSTEVRSFSLSLMLTTHGVAYIV
ncbi:hypothetical protein PV327_005125 [Microctonus hyperodae]|uniref:BTB domain-containing protein n=1 Tax=Microctonus hyperodae TaxID=165561 RepID=A0AA39KZH7_MICHY|nr:hypothetical protein PV327_005125 [Microctonus hyperodae]